MRGGYAWLASFVVLPIVGAPLLKVRAFHVLGFPARAVLSGAVGAVFLSLTMTVFALAGLRWGPLLLLVSAALAFAVRLLVPKDGEIPSARGREVGATVFLAYTITAISVLAALAATMAGFSTSADLLLFWGPKAQQFAAARTIDVAFLSQPFLEYLHIYYPPLVTNLFAFGAMLAGRFPWGAATLTFPLVLAATAIGLVGILKTESGTARAAATSALVTSSLALLGIHALVAGNADPFLLFFEILVVALLLTPVTRTTAGKLLAGLLFAGAAASKVEGLAFLVAAVPLFLIIERGKLGSVPRSLLLLVGPTMVTLGTWFAFGATRKLFFGYQSYGRVLDLYWEHFDEVLSGFGRAFWSDGYALPFVVPLLVLILSPEKTRQALLPIGIALALAAFFTFTYLHSKDDPTVWIGWSGTRVFSPIAGLFALAAWCSRPAQTARREITDLS